MKPKHILLATVVAGSLAAAPVVVAEGDPVRGQRLAETCMGCHGIEGARNAYPSYRVPKLGGQTEQYLFNSLVAYRDGRRSHRTMQALAATLSEQDMRDIAAFFAQPKQ